MTVWQAITGFALVAGVLTLVPGLDTTLVLRTALTRGREQAASAAAGVCLGLLIWGIAAAVGAAALLAASEVAYRLVTFAGIAYMVYLGVGMIVRTFRTDRDAPSETKTVERGRRRAFVAGAATNTLNPKIGVFYIATIPQFLPAGSNPLAMGLVLAATHALLTTAWLAVIIVAAHRARRWLARPTALRVVDRVAGVVIIGFAGRLALQTR